MKKQGERERDRPHNLMKGRKRKEEKDLLGQEGRRDLIIKFGDEKKEEEEEEERKKERRREKERGWIWLT